MPPEDATTVRIFEQIEEVKVFLARLDERFKAAESHRQRIEKKVDAIVQPCIGFEGLQDRLTKVELNDAAQSGEKKFPTWALSVGNFAKFALPWGTAIAIAYFK